MTTFIASGNIRHHYPIDRDPGRGFRRLRPLMVRAPRSLSVMLLVLFSSIASLSAQSSSLSITVERPSRLIAADGYTTFQIDAVNTSQSPIDLQIIRIVNDLPGDGWLSSVCSPHHCYDATVDTLAPYAIEAGATGGAQVHIYTGAAGSGRVVLLLDPQDGTEPVQVEVVTTVGEIPEPALFIREDSIHATVVGNDTAVFQIAILNTTDDTLRVSVERLETDFPDAMWKSILCLFADCMPADIDTLPVVELEGGRAMLVFLKVVAGNVLDDEGQVELKIDAGDGSEPSYRRYSVSVGQVTNVRNESTGRVTMNARPNPAQSHLSIFLPAAASGKSIPIHLYDLRGARIDLAPIAAGPVADGHARLLVDVEDLTSGRWFWQVEIDGVSYSGTFQIER